MKPADETLIAQALSAHRNRDADGRPVADAAWLDLDAEGREALFDATLQQRRLEAALDRDGLDLEFVTATLPRRADPATH